MPLNAQPVVILWNSSSGWSDDEQQARQVQEILSKGGSTLLFERVRKGQDITAKTRRHIRGEPKVLVGAGGDGTINAVASAVVNTPNALGVIPSGTLNHFARDLAIPLTSEGAAETLVSGSEIQVDVGTVNDRLFLNNSVIGLYPVYRAAREAYERRGLGANRVTRFLAVLRGLIRVLWHLPRLQLDLTLEDGRRFKIRTAFVLIANNEHEVEQWNIGHRESLDQGHLWIYILKRSTRWSLAVFFVRFLLKRFSRHEAFEIFKARSLRVDTRTRHLKVGVDGEIVRLETPLEYRSLPRALRVIAPSKGV
jgi:diacylglycerol kinase family enzyme